MKRSAWPKAPAVDHSPGFRWAVRLIVLVGLFAIAYQLSNGELCTMRSGQLVCTAGASSYMLAAALSFGFLGITAITLPRRWAGFTQKVCWFLAAVCALAGVAMRF